MTAITSFSQFPAGYCQAAGGLVSYGCSSQSAAAMRTSYDNLFSTRCTLQVEAPIDFPWLATVEGLHYAIPVSVAASLACSWSRNGNTIHPLYQLAQILYKSRRYGRSMKTPCSFIQPKRQHT